MSDEEYTILYRKCLKYITYISGKGYLYVDFHGEWHGIYETEADAIAHFAFYLNNADFGD